MTIKDLIKYKIEIDYNTGFICFDFIDDSYHICYCLYKNISKDDIDEYGLYESVCFKIKGVGYYNNKTFLEKTL